MMSEILFMYLKVFGVGGALCVIAQILINYTKLTAGKILVYFLLAGVFLQAIGVYQYLVDFAGAGATVPLLGFGNTLWKGMQKAIDQDGFLGIFRGGFTASAAGICAALVFGYLASIIFQPKMKK